MYARCSRMQVRASPADELQALRLRRHGCASPSGEVLNLRFRRCVQLTPPRTEPWSLAAPLRPSYHLQFWGFHEAVV